MWWWLSLILLADACGVYTLRKYVKRPVGYEWLALSALLAGLATVLLGLAVRNGHRFSPLWRLRAILGLVVGLWLILYVFGGQLSELRYFGTLVTMAGLVIIMITEREGNTLIHPVRAMVD